jgi:23S rRNA pseudouridine955/2504/2580 synthase
MSTSTKEASILSKFFGLRRLFLHAHQLTFTNPSTGEIQTIKAPLSAELQAFLATL